ncbi:hypothetical protein SDC9_86329 [bioreactor metagenome]|uniref:Uncharacterized protein n=1 Tax=bioreactor metagenome TaxID=1076179 RepID=A0A644ZFN2_9ZZZZ
MCCSARFSRRERTFSALARCFSSSIPYRSAAARRDPSAIFTSSGRAAERASPAFFPSKGSAPEKSDRISPRRPNRTLAAFHFCSRRFPSMPSAFFHCSSVKSRGLTARNISALKDGSPLLHNPWAPQANAPPRRTRSAAPSSAPNRIDLFFMCSASLCKMPGCPPVRQHHTPENMNVPFSQSAGISRKINPCRVPLNQPLLSAVFLCRIMASEPGKYASRRIRA